jgi:valyl-tRNA synthetase
VKRTGEEVSMIKAHNIPVWKCPDETHYYVQLTDTNKNRKTRVGRVAEDVGGLPSKCQP